MVSKNRVAAGLPVLLLGIALSGCARTWQEPNRPEGTVGFDVVEASIGDIHRAMREGRVTSRQLVQRYLDRIEAYDKQGAALNAIILVNSNNRPRLEWALKQDTPSVLDMAAAVSSDQINRYSRDSIGITRLFFENCASCGIRFFYLNSKLNVLGITLLSFPFPSETVEQMY